MKSIFDISNIGGLICEFNQILQTNSGPTVYKKYIFKPIDPTSINKSPYSLCEIVAYDYEHPFIANRSEPPHTLTAFRPVSIDDCCGNELLIEKPENFWDKTSRNIVYFIGGCRGKTIEPRIQHDAEGSYVFGTQKVIIDPQGEDFAEVNFKLYDGQKVFHVPRKKLRTVRLKDQQLKLISTIEHGFVAPPTPPRWQFWRRGIHEKPPEYT